MQNDSSMELERSVLATGVDDFNLLLLLSMSELWVGVLRGKTGQRNGRNCLLGAGALSFTCSWFEA